VQLSLVVLNGKHAGRTIRVKESEFSIGRESDCDLRPKSKRISRRHCIILVEPQRVVVRDLDSRNGTFVNGEKIEAERSLNNRDRLAIGQMKLEVQLTADATATTGSPPPAAESQPTVEAPAETASISGIAFSILESDSSDDDFELTEQSAEPRRDGRRAHRILHVAQWPAGLHRTGTTGNRRRPRIAKRRQPC